jgi:hypothetical protein
MNIPTIFVQLDKNQTIAVHDYTFDGTDFDYVPDAWIGCPIAASPPPDFAGVIVRPIISPIDILDMLQSNACVCGAVKERGRSHCGACYRSLPITSARDLYKRFRKGYEQAFLRSLIELIDMNRTSVEKIRAAIPKPKL